MQNSRKNKILEKVRCALLYSLPAALFFSYHPVIQLGADSSTNFELSLALIWLLIFAIFNLPATIKKLRQDPKLLLLFIPLIYISLTILWSANRLRAVLTAGILACILMAILNFKDYLTSKKAKRNFINLTLLSAVTVSVFCWIQCVLDILDVKTTGLCEGCTYINLGFPHPNGFAIEPQFMGNLLLAPALVCLYILQHKTGKKQGKNKQRKILTAAFIIIASTLFLTLSRGAIFAFIIALIILAIHEKKLILKPAILTILSFVLALTAQGVFTAVAPTSDSFITGVSKSLSQLTFNVIKPVSPTTRTFSDQTISNTKPAGEFILVDQEEPLFNGYVEESTTTRLSLNQKAISLWLDNPTNTILGIGLGSSGTKLYEKFPELGHPKEIVQNEYFAVLLELGLVGAILIAITIIKIATYASQKIKNKTKKIYLVALLAAYAFTLLFFSGLPNALHIYLLPALLYIL